MEEQFDLDEYEDQDELKETDIVSDEDDASATLRGRTAEADLEARITALSLASEETEESESLVSPEDALEKKNGEDEDTVEVWVRRGQSGLSPADDM